MKTDSDSPLRGNFGPTSARVSASPSLSSTHYGPENLCGAEGNKRCAAVIDVCKQPPITLHGLYGSSMSAKPPSESPQLLPQLNKRPERQWPLPLARQRPQTFLMGRAEPEDCHSASAGSSGTPNIRPSMTRFARLKEKRCRDSEPSPEKLSGTTPFFRCAPGWLRSDPTIFPTNHRDSTLLCPRPHRGEYRLRYLQ